MIGVTIQFGGVEVVLHPERALFLPAARELFVADVHLGKAQLFRDAGLPVPAGTTADNLARLDRLIADTRPAGLTLLGDLFHGRLDDDAPLRTALAEWRRRLDTPVRLLPGNHDVRTIDTLRGIDIEVCDDFVLLGPLHFAHAPAPRRRRPLVCGHLHPGVRLRDFDGSGVTVPCFVVERDLLVLPAFGRFTGLQRVHARPGRRLYAAAAGRVVRVPSE